MQFYSQILLYFLSYFNPQQAVVPGPRLQIHEGKHLHARRNAKSCKHMHSQD